ncbi:hypothetical protein V1477_005088, partial [Vespula maculifrons]
IALVQKKKTCNPLRKTFNEQIEYSQRRLQFGECEGHREPHTLSCFKRSSLGLSLSSAIHDLEDRIVDPLPILIQTASLRWFVTRRLKAELRIGLEVSSKFTQRQPLRTLQRISFFAKNKSRSFFLTELSSSFITFSIRLAHEHSTKSNIKQTTRPRKTRRVPVAFLLENEDGSGFSPKPPSSRYYKINLQLLPPPQRTPLHAARFSRGGKGGGEEEEEEEEGG